MNQNGNGAPQLPPLSVGLSGQNQRPGLGPVQSIPQLAVLSFEQRRQQQQQQQPQQPQQQQQRQQQQPPPRDDDWAQPPPHPSEWRALTPISERPTRDSSSLDAGTYPPPLQQPGLCVVNGSPQSDQIQPQPSETSQDLPKLQADTEPSTFLGDPLVMSPTSHTPLRELGIGRSNSAGSLGSKPDSTRSIRDSALPPRPDSKLDTHLSTDAVSTATPPLSSPEKLSTFSQQPASYSYQPINPVLPIFSGVPKTPPGSSDRPTFTPPIRKGSGMDPGSGSPAPSSPSRFQGATQRREAGSPSNSITAATKAKTPEPTPLTQMDPRPVSPPFSPTPTTVNSFPTLTHTATTTSTTSQSEYSGYSDGMRPSPLQQMPFSSPSHSNQGSHSQPSNSTSQPQRMAQGESSQKESPSTSSPGRLEGAKPVTRADGGERERSGDDHDLIKEAGALYYMQEIQGASAVSPPKIVGRGQNILVNSKGRSDGDDEDEGEEPSTEDEPRPLPRPMQPQPHPQQRLLPEPSPLQVRRPSAQAKASFVAPPPPPPLPKSPPQYPIHSPSHPAQSQHQGLGYAQDRQQPILAPQPQQPVISSFNPINTLEGDTRPPNPSSPGSDTNSKSSTVDLGRTPVIGRGSSVGGSRPGLVSRPSGARDLVLKQRGGPISSRSRHNGQPRHSLPPHLESFAEKPSQSPSYSTHQQPSHYQGQIFAQTPGDTARQTSSAIGTVDGYPANMANVDQRQHYDDNSDALAALTFLERDEANAVRKPLPSQENRDPRSGAEANVYNAPPVYVTPSDGGDDVSQDGGSYDGKYRSSFTPSKHATQRLAKSQAQQAAHQAAVHRPGKSGSANGKGKRRVPQGGWAESSDEEEDEEDEEDEDVDSDGDPIAPGRGQGPGPRPGQNLGKISAQGSPYGSTTELNQLEQGRPQRFLPRPPSPGRGYGTCALRNALVS